MKTIQLFGGNRELGDYTVCSKKKELKQKAITLLKNGFQGLFRGSLGPQVWDI